MRSSLLHHAAAAILAFPLLAAPAFAAGDGGGGGGNGGGNSGGGNSGSKGDHSNTVENCRKGLVWDKSKSKCVAPKQGLLDNESIYEAGRDLADAERYDEAIKVLSLASNKNDARVLNYLGYSHRKSGRVLVGLGYYQEAIKVDPKYTLVREYLGEAYLQLGDVNAAKTQLGEIKKLCGGPQCHEYEELSEQIDKYQRSRS